MSWKINKQTQKESSARFLWGSLFPARVIYETRASSSLSRTSLSTPGLPKPSWKHTVPRDSARGCLYLFISPPPPPTCVSPLALRTQTNSILPKKDRFSLLPKPSPSPHSNQHFDILKINPFPSPRSLACPSGLCHCWKSLECTLAGCGTAACR